MHRRTFLSAAGMGAVARLVGAESGFRWQTPPPGDCPVARSGVIKGLLFTGRHAEYAHADTWYPSWASDGNLYSPWTDGEVNGVRCMSIGKNASTGSAKVAGDSPLGLQIADVSTYAGSPVPYGGRYPCGSLVKDGVWYYGTYCLDDSDGDPGKGLNWDILGPCVGFRHSNDLGKSWTETPHTPAAPLFGEPARQDAPVKMGAPHFVDFGRNLQHSPDGKAYLVGHGAEANDPKPRPANLSWITGDQIYLARVEPSIANINDLSKYEFFAGRDARNRVVWTPQFSKIRPIFEWNNNAGCVTMTYNAPLRRYLMCITDGVDTIGKFNTYILESESPTGPWRLVEYLRAFGEQAYFVNISSKFISADGRTIWLLYAANFTSGNQHWPHHRSNPPGGRYGMCWQEIQLL